MITFIGNSSLSIAVLVAAVAVCSTIGAIRFRSPKWNKILCGSVVLIAIMLTAASGALFAAILQSQFQFEYVANHSEKSLPFGYKIAAFWAGQEGSLLLWGWLQSVVCVIAVWKFGKWRGTDHAIAVGTMGAICGFFAVLILFASNPFTQFDSDLIPHDGRGLNPQLQDFRMIAHPPLLFLGYAGFAVPFTILIGVLASGRNDPIWIKRVRRWILVSWCFLTAGIVLGAWWAYAELGWGGYWAWDPVENASLLPWLTATALIHSIMIQRIRGMFKWWNAILITLTFNLCFLGTYITRSGIVESVHSYSESSAGNFFLVFLITCVCAAGVLMVIRRDLLRAEYELNELLSLEGMVLMGNVMLIIMMLVTISGTLLPAISSVFFENPVSIKAPFFNTLVVPFALVLVFLMAHSSAVSRGQTGFRRILRGMILPCILATLASIATIVFLWDTWSGSFTAALTSERFTPELKESFGNARTTLLVTFIATLGIGNVVSGITHSISAGHKALGLYGGQIAHLGVLLVVIGVAGSSLYQTTSRYELGVGESIEQGGSTLTLQSLGERYESNFGAVEAVVRIVDHNGSVAIMKPQQRIYKDREHRPNHEVAILTTLRKDLYISLVDWKPDGEMAVIQVLTNPLVVWIWIGGGGIVLGGVLSCMPQLPKTLYLGNESANNQASEPFDHRLNDRLTGDTA